MTARPDRAHDRTGVADVTEATPPQILPTLYDADGNEYLPRHPQPGIVSVSLCAIELLELWHLFSQRAANAAAVGNAEWWAESECMANDRLAWAVLLAPALAGLQRQSPGVSPMEGKC